MVIDANRLARAMQRFDAVNATDPRQRELRYAEQMTQWLHRIDPQASDALQLAARSQHIRRWEIPRSEFPVGRTGYLQWRRCLYRFHAEAAVEILLDEGFDAKVTARVDALLQKRGLKNDPEMQTLEDVACLVFLENYFADFSRTRDETKLLNILRRTWAKMSPRGREFALTLDLGKAERALLDRALVSQ